MCPTWPPCSHEWKYVRIWWSNGTYASNSWNLIILTYFKWWIGKRKKRWIRNGACVRNNLSSSVHVSKSCCPFGIGQCSNLIISGDVKVWQLELFHAPAMLILVAERPETSHPNHHCHFQRGAEWPIPLLPEAGTSWHFVFFPFETYMMPICLTNKWRESWKKRETRRFQNHEGATRIYKVTQACSLVQTISPNGERTKTDCLTQEDLSNLSQNGIPLCRNNRTQWKPQNTYEHIVQVQVMDIFWRFLLRTLTGSMN